MKILALNCSPTAGGKTAAALQAVLRGCTDAGADCALVELAEHADLADVVARMADADAFVFGSPMYRASYAWPFKALLDRTPRGLYGEDSAPLAARAVLTVATAASDHHMLGVQAMRNVLVDFFAAHVVSPGVYLTGAAFTPERTLNAENAEAAGYQGIALVELARAIDGSVGLRRAAPPA